MVEAGTHPATAVIQIMAMHFILPALVTYVIAYGMRKAGWIKDGYMKLEVQ